MSKFGKVTDVYLPKDFHTKQPRGIAFVQFATQAEAAAAVAGFDGHRLGERVLGVQYAEHGRRCGRGGEVGGLGEGSGPELMRPRPLSCVRSPQRRLPEQMARAEASLRGPRGRPAAAAPWGGGVGGGGRDGGRRRSRSRTRSRSRSRSRRRASSSRSRSRSPRRERKR